MEQRMQAQAGDAALAGSEGGRHSRKGRRGELS